MTKFSERLGGGKGRQLLEDLMRSAAIMAAPDGSRVIFQIAGYERPPYHGQHSFGVEGKMYDGDDAELTILIYADENDRLLELEIIRWDAADLVGPRWETLTLQ